MISQTNMTTVFVSGATGFIAQHLVKQLLAKNYQVIGSVRSQSKGDHLKELFKSTSFDYVVVDDIAKSGAFDEALKAHPEVSVFLHTASPFHFKVKDYEKELLTPAIEGTKNALAAIKAYGSNVKKVVITSSYAAVGTADTENDPKEVRTEESWNAISWDGALKDPVNAYRGSKTFAEQAAWKFLIDEKPGFTLATVNPSFVFGPQAFDSEVKAELNTSSEILNNIIKLGPDGAIPAINAGWTDVRDVARAHIVAFEKEQATGERLILFQSRYNGQQIIDILNKHFPELKGKIPVGVPGSGDKAYLDYSRIDASKTLSILGFELINLETSVVDSIKQILDSRK